MSSQFAKRILIAEPDPYLQGVLRNFLGRDFRVDVAGSSDEVFAILNREPANAFLLLLADTDLAPLNGFDLAAKLGVAYPQLKVAFTTRNRVEDMFPALRRSQVGHVFVKTAPFLFDEFRVSVENLIWPQKSIGLKRYLHNPIHLSQEAIQTKDDRDSMIAEALNFLRAYRQYDTEVTEIRLVLEEMVNNAIYHSFRRPTSDGGGEKYKASTFRCLENNEQVVLEWGCDKTYLGLAVTDNCGTLDPSTIMSKLERHTSMEGIFDESGRGLHLTRTLTDRMIVNVKPGRLSQVIMLFARRPMPLFKPLQINVISENLDSKISKYSSASALG